MRSSPAPQRPATVGTYPLPGRSAVLRQRGVGSNLSLALNKLVGPWDNGEMTPDARVRLLEQCAAIWGTSGSTEAEAIRRDHVARRAASLRHLVEQGWEVRETIAAPTWRMVSGLGISSPLEVNLAVHRLGGFPYLPGSSVKGATRAFAELELGVEPGAVVPELIMRVFGTPDQAGGVIFLEALPVTRPQLELDVINAHYPEYYAEASGPTEWQNPRPLTFLAIGAATRFGFSVASREAELADLTLGWLRGAMETLGLGGKTAAGYGYFDPASDPH